MSLQEIVGLLVAFCTLLGFMGKLITTLSALNYTIRSTNEALATVQQDFEKLYAHNSESHKSCGSITTNKTVLLKITKYGLH